MDRSNCVFALGYFVTHSMSGAITEPLYARRKGSSPITKDHKAHFRSPDIGNLGSNPMQPDAEVSALTVALLAAFPLSHMASLPLLRTMFRAAASPTDQDDVPQTRAVDCACSPSAHSRHSTLVPPRINHGPRRRPPLQIKTPCQLFRLARKMIC